jgi:hypothetical protein
LSVASPRAPRRTNTGRTVPVQPANPSKLAVYRVQHEGKSPMNGCKSFGSWPIWLIVVAAVFAADPAVAWAQLAWNLQDTAGPPAYATTVLSTTNLNIEGVVLACERADDRNVLQLQLFPSGGDASLRVVGPPAWPSLCFHGLRHSPGATLSGSRTYSVRPESAGRNMPPATSIARARISNRMEPLAVPSDWKSL